MPHVTKHTRKVSTRPVKPYACESSREKRQQDRRSDRQSDGRTDRQTDTQTGCPKPLSSTFWGLYITNPDLSRSRFFSRWQYFHWHGSKIWTAYFELYIIFTEKHFQAGESNAATAKNLNPGNEKFKFRGRSDFAVQPDKFKYHTIQPVAMSFFFLPDLSFEPLMKVLGLTLHKLFLIQKLRKINKKPGLKQANTSMSVPPLASYK